MTPPPRSHHATRKDITGVRKIWEKAGRGRTGGGKDNALIEGGIEAGPRLQNETDHGDTDAGTTATTAIETVADDTPGRTDETTDMRVGETGHIPDRAAARRNLNVVKPAPGAIDIGFHPTARYPLCDRALDLPNRAGVIDTGKAAVGMGTTVPVNAIPLADPRCGKSHLDLRKQR